MRRFVIGSLRAVYRLLVSPALHLLGGGGGCRFHPTCGDYAFTALELHGFGRGSKLAFLRVIRCHPGCAGGEDPVPPNPRPRTIGVVSQGPNQS